MGDFQIAGDHQRQRGRLDAPLSHNPDISGFPALDGHRAGSVGTDKPVRALTGKRGVMQMGIPCILFKMRQGMGDCRVIQGGQPDSERFARVAALFNDFIHQELTFPIRIARIDHAIGAGQKRPYDLDLRRYSFIFSGFKTPLFRNNWQRVSSPLAELLAIAFRHDRLEKMPEAPCHYILPAVIEAVFFRPASESLRYDTGQGGLFSYKYSHDVSFLI